MSKHKKTASSGSSQASSGEGRPSLGVPGGGNHSSAFSPVAPSVRAPMPHSLPSIRRPKPPTASVRVPPPPPSAPIRLPTVQRRRGETKAEIVKAMERVLDIVENDKGQIKRLTKIVEHERNQRKRLQRMLQAKTDQDQAGQSRAPTRPQTRPRVVVSSAWGFGSEFVPSEYADLLARLQKRRGSKTEYIPRHVRQRATMSTSLPPVAGTPRVASLVPPSDRLLVPSEKQPGGSSGASQSSGDSGVGDNMDSGSSVYPPPLEDYEAPPSLAGETAFPTGTATPAAIPPEKPVNTLEKVSAGTAAVSTSLPPVAETPRVASLVPLSSDHLVPSEKQPGGSSGASQSSADSGVGDNMDSGSSTTAVPAEKPDISLNLQEGSEKRLPDLQPINSSGKNEPAGNAGGGSTRPPFPLSGCVYYPPPPDKDRDTEFFPRPVIFATPTGAVVRALSPATRMENARDQRLSERLGNKDGTDKSVSPPKSSLKSPKTPPVASSKLWSSDWRPDSTAGPDGRVKWIQRPPPPPPPPPTTPPAPRTRVLARFFTACMGRGEETPPAPPASKTAVAPAPSSDAEDAPLPPTPRQG